MTVQQRTIKSFGIAMLGFVVAITAQVLAPVSAQAQVALPEAPQITLTAATCEAKENKLTVKMPNGSIDKNGKATNKATGYRFVLYVGDKAIKQLNKDERKKLYEQGWLSGEELMSKVLDALKPYGEKVTVKAFWFDKDNKFSTNQEKIKLEVGTPLTKAIPLAESNEIMLVDPAKLACTQPADPQPAPKLGLIDLPILPVFSLQPAICPAKKNTLIVENKDSLKDEEKGESYRFVVSLESGEKVQLNTALRQKLLTDGKLAVEDIIPVYYPGKIIPYGKKVTVQAYYFDKKRQFDESLYDTDLKLTVGESDRFIKLGEAKSAMLVNPTCDQPTNPVDPVNPVDPGQGTQPTPPVDNSGATTQPINPVDQAAVPIPAPVAPVKPVQSRTTKLADTGVDQQAIIAVAFVMLTLGAVVLARRLA